MLAVVVVCRAEESTVVYPGTCFSVPGTMFFYFGRVVKTGVFFSTVRLCFLLSVSVRIESVIWSSPEKILFSF